jgi:hypothetical protein
MNEDNEYSVLEIVTWVAIAIIITSGILYLLNS